ncbi:CatA-like O-acetyltransferase [Pseudoalteromonas sp. T1lg65]|uniref:CatA-like O-acetyltransferase n=1 Tax=Pseudoalteromonas sp. T1lg65 TaxID=2077101 RepID=UPI003F7A7418
MKKHILKTDWARAEHFSFYRDFEQPYFTITTNINIEKVFRLSQLHGIPFSMCCLYVLQRAIDCYAPMRLRIEGDEVYEYEQVTISTIFLRDTDNSFRFARLERDDDLAHYVRINQRIKAESIELNLLSDAFAQSATVPDCVHVSILPWLTFTSFSHARANRDDSGIPKLVLGQFNKADGTIPVCIEVHHALMDGLHVSEFVEMLKEKVTNFECPYLDLTM